MAAQMAYHNAMMAMSSSGSQHGVAGTPDRPASPSSTIGAGSQYGHNPNPNAFPGGYGGYPSMGMPNMPYGWPGMMGWPGHNAPSPPPGSPPMSPLPTGMGLPMQGMSPGMSPMGGMPGMPNMPGMNMPGMNGMPGFGGGGGGYGAGGSSEWLHPQMSGNANGNGNGNGHVNGNGHGNGNGNGSVGGGSQWDQRSRVQSMVSDDGLGRDGRDHRQPAS
jgi:hypothetical protein